MSELDHSEATTLFQVARARNGFTQEKTDSADRIVSAVVMAAEKAGVLEAGRKNANVIVVLSQRLCVAVRGGNVVIALLAAAENEHWETVPLSYSPESKHHFSDEIDTDYCNHPGTFKRRKNPVTVVTEALLKLAEAQRTAR